MRHKYFLFVFFFFISAVASLAQSESDETGVFQNKNFQRSTDYTVFDSQPIYNSDWEWLHPTPQGNNLRYLKVWDANNWYALGYSGTFLKTSDGGSTWFLNKNIGGQSSSGFGYNLFGGYFLDMNTGLACGESGTLVRTTDAGLTWNSVFAGPTGFIYDLFFLNSTTGFACGLTSVGLLKTTDAGLTWNQVSVPTDNAYTVYAFDENNILLGSANGNVLRTTDGGTNWSTVFAAGTSLIWSLGFMDANNGMAGGIDAALAYTTDAGATWTTANTGIPSTSDFFDLEYRGNAFYATGDPYDMYYTTDLGATWSSFDYTDPGQAWTSGFFETEFITDNHFVTVGAIGMINETVIMPNSATAHNMWIKAGTLYDNWAESPTGRVISVGAPGISGTTFDHSIFSTDGGETWAVSTLIDSTEHDFNSLSMVNSLTGYAACEDHFVYKTTDGGASWFQVTQPAVSSSDLEAIFFIDENTGYTFGAGGLGYKTTDGGSSWTTLTTGSTSILRSAYFLDAMNGFVCGSSGVLLKTTDGGATFTALDPNNTSTLYSVYMVDNNTGFLCGSSGRVRKTTDGGATWDTVDVGNTLTTLYDIKFRDENNGIVVGSTGRTFITTDGGASWLFENTGASTIYSVYIEESSAGVAAAYTCGSLGYVQKNSNAILPVELASLTASVNGNAVTLLWTTSSEINNAGFEIERKGNSDWQKIGYVAGFGTSTELKNYSFKDNNLSAGKYSYRLKQIDFDGTFNYSFPVETEIFNPDKFILSQNYPNPFNPSTQINFHIAVNSKVTLKVFDILGQEVSTLINGSLDAGIHNINFNAGNINSGIYFYTLEAAGINGQNFSSTKKMMLIK